MANICEVWIQYDLLAMFENVSTLAATVWNNVLFSFLADYKIRSNEVLGGKFIALYRSVLKIQISFCFDMVRLRLF
jgi:hypothetical protein